MSEDDAPVASLPVFISAAPSPSACFELFQYPLYARERSLPVPATAAQRGQHVTSRWRPHADRVEMEIPLDMREMVYNRERGAELAESCGSMGTIPTPGETRVKQEDRGTSAEMPRFDRMRLDSHVVPNATQYMVGTVRNGELHLTPLHAIQQLRPSMQHVDLLHQAEEHSRRVPTSDDEGPASETDTRRGVVALNVSMRTTEMGGRTSLAPRFSAQGAPSSASPNQRDADAERWVDLRFVDKSTMGPEEATEPLLARVREPLVCTSNVGDFF